MDRVIKNFLYYKGANASRFSFDCPELVGQYYMRVLQWSCVENTVNMMCINSPQLITNQSKAPNYIYNPTNIDIQYINFIVVGFSGQRTMVFDDLVAIMDMNGRFDYLNCYFNSAWGGNPLGFTIINNNVLLITAEFKKIPQKIYKPLTYSAENKKKRILANFYATPSTTSTANYSYTSNLLVGRFRVKLLNNYMLSQFPLNVGSYIISPQFSSSIIGGRYYTSEARNNRRVNFGYSSEDVIGDFYGRCDITLYSSRNQAIEPISSCLFVFAFEEI